MFPAPVTLPAQPFRRSANRWRRRFVHRLVSDCRAAPTGRGSFRSDCQPQRRQHPSLQTESAVECQSIDSLISGLRFLPPHRRSHCRDPGHRFPSCWRRPCRPRVLCQRDSPPPCCCGRSRWRCLGRRTQSSRRTSCPLLGSVTIHTARGRLKSIVTGAAAFEPKITRSSSASSFSRSAMMRPSHLLIGRGVERSCASAGGFARRDVCGSAVVIATAGDESSHLCCTDRANAGTVSEAVRRIKSPCPSTIDAGTTCSPANANSRSFPRDSRETNRRFPPGESSAISSPPPARNSPTAAQEIPRSSWKRSASAGSALLPEASGIVN